MKIVGFAVFTIHEYTLHILIYTLILILQTPDWFPKLALPLSVLQTALCQLCYDDLYCSSFSQKKYVIIKHVLFRKLVSKLILLNFLNLPVKSNSVSNNVMATYE